MDAGGLPVRFVSGKINIYTYGHSNKRHISNTIKGYIILPNTDTFRKVTFSIEE
jgi:hypothetical protein